MHIFNNGVIVYGWCEINNTHIINDEWLAKNYIYKFSSDTINNIPSEIIYGISCSLDFENGKIIIDNGSKEHVDKAYTQILNYNEENNINVPKLGYYIALNGDFNWNRYINYIPQIIEKTELNNIY